MNKKIYKKKNSKINIEGQQEFDQNLNPNTSNQGSEKMGSHRLNMSGQKRLGILPKLQKQEKNKCKKIKQIPKNQIQTVPQNNSIIFNNKNFSKNPFLKNSQYQKYFSNSEDQYNSDDDIQLIQEQQNIPFGTYISQNYDQYDSYEEDIQQDSDTYQSSQSDQNIYYDDDDYQQFQQQEDDQQDSIFKYPRKRKFAQVQFQQQAFIGINSYIDLTEQQKKKYFKQINKNYTQSLQIQQQYKILAKKTIQKQKISLNKKVKSVKFCDKVKSKTFKKDMTPKQINQVPQTQEKIIKKIWQYQ